MVNIARDLLDQSLRQRPPINSLWFLGFSQRAKTARAETNAAPEEEERTPRIEGRRRWIVTSPCCRAVMTRTNRAAIGVLLLLTGLPALAQVDFTGEWAPRFHEDEPERIPGPELGDYLGLPLNDAARLRADSWDASIQTLPEHQCIPHPSTYSFRGPSNLRVSREFDPVTQDIVAYTIYGTFGRATRTIWMDGLPIPPRTPPIPGPERPRWSRSG